MDKSDCADEGYDVITDGATDDYFKPGYDYCFNTNDGALTPVK